MAGLTKGAASCVAQGSPARGASQRSRRLQVTQEGIEPAEDTLVEGAGAPWRLRRRRRRRPTMLLVLSISIGSKPRYCLYRVEGRSRSRARRVCNLSCTPRGARETSRMYGTLQIPSVIAEEEKNLQSAQAEKAASHYAAGILSSDGASRVGAPGRGSMACGSMAKEHDELKSREVAERAREERLHLAMELGAKLQGVWAKKALAKVGFGGGESKMCMLSCSRWSRGVVRAAAYSSRFLRRSTRASKSESAFGSGRRRRLRRSCAFC